MPVGDYARKGKRNKTGKCIQEVQALTSSFPVPTCPFPWSPSWGPHPGTRCSATASSSASPRESLAGGDSTVGAGHARAPDSRHRSRGFGGAPPPSGGPCTPRSDGGTGEGKWGICRGARHDWYAIVNSCMINVSEMRLRLKSDYHFVCRLSTIGLKKKEQSIWGKKSPLVRLTASHTNIWWSSEKKLIILRLCKTKQ